MFGKTEVLGMVSEAHDDAGAVIGRAGELDAGGFKGEFYFVQTATTVGRNVIHSLKPCDCCGPDVRSFSQYFYWPIKCTSGRTYLSTGNQISCLMIVN